MTQFIPLTRGLVATVDDEDFDLVSHWKWHASDSRRGHRYAITKDPSDTTRVIRMHRLILRAPTGLFVDHINGDGLLNVRSNLRLATRAENKRNSVMWKGKGVGHMKGVVWCKRERNWRAAIHVDDKRVHLGIFAEQEAAARAYDSAAVHFYGEFAALNFADRAPVAFNPSAPIVGAEPHRKKLTDEDVIAIAGSDLPTKELIARYGMKGRSQINRIRRGVGRIDVLERAAGVKKVKR